MKEKHLSLHFLLVANISRTTSPLHFRSEYYK